MINETLTPRATVAELDRHIIGQRDAKRAIAIALRNRWRRKQLGGAMQSEVVPKNILMIGPTGVGKTEVARRVAQLTDAPFIKVDATKFTEVGYVGRDVETIMRDLAESALRIVNDRKVEESKGDIETRVREKLIDRLSPATVGRDTKLDADRSAIAKRLDAGDLDNEMIEVPRGDISGGSDDSAQSIEEVSKRLSSMIRSIGDRDKLEKVTVEEARRRLRSSEFRALTDMNAMREEAVALAENEGIVFIDEIDKICARDGMVGGEISREGVQRDLLPIIEGTTVKTRAGPVNSHHVLFVCAGAFHTTQPSDLLPELQGRLPVRVELEELSAQDMSRILNEPEFSLVKQYVALLRTDGVDLTFTPDGVHAISSFAHNENVMGDNIGARRLHTVMERLLDETSFEADGSTPIKVVIDEAFCKVRLSADVASGEGRSYIL